MSNQIAVVTLCGCPASGKSTVARLMMQELASIASVYYISFDKVEKLLNTTNVWDRNAWKQSREKAYQLISSLLYDLKNNTIQSFADDAVTVVINTNTTFSIIIIDDTMHLRSMRRSVMHLCQFYEVGYCTVHIQCSLEKCLLRNSQREDKVPESTIQTVYNDMEPPDTQFYWEKYSTSLSTEDNGYLLSSSLFLVITEASLHPLHPNKTEKEINIASYSSFKHQLELELRRAVGRIAQDLDSKQKHRMRDINDMKKKMQRISYSLSDIVDETNKEDIISNIIEQFTAQCSNLLKGQL